MSNLKFLRGNLVAFLVIVFIGHVPFAAAQKVEPRYFYSYNQVLFETQEAERAAVIAYWRLLSIPYEDFTEYGAIVPCPPCGNGTLNGHPTSFAVQYKYLPGHPLYSIVNPPGHPPAGYALLQMPGPSSECPVGYDSYFQGGAYTNFAFTHICVKPEPCLTCTVGNPISISSGVKIQHEIDYQGAGGLQFSRKFHSDRGGWSHDYKIKGIDIGSAPDVATRDALLSGLSCVPGIGATTGWPYCFKQVNPSFALPAASFPNEFLLERGNSRLLKFGTATDLTPAADINDRVSKLIDANGQTTGWSVYNASNDATEYFDASGRLERIVARNGEQKILTYSDASTPASIASTPGLLVRMTDSFGRQLNFTYDSLGRMATLIDPAGVPIQYGYDEPSSIALPGRQPAGNLTSVTYADGKKRIYWYNEQDKTSGSNLPYALTGITDENGVRFAIFKYDATGKAISTEHTGGVEKYALNYAWGETQGIVVDPLGASREYNFSPVLGVLKFTGMTQPTGVGSPWTFSRVNYDANGNVASRADFKAIATTYVYDLTRNLETSRTEASGTPEVRTISTSWHPTYRLPLSITEPGKASTFGYDASGNLLTKTITANGAARSWSYIYNSLGQVLTVTGPRADVPDVTTYAYDAQGNLVSVLNALGQLTTLSNYDAHGRAGRVRDTNGLTTDLLYSPRGWLLSKTVTGAGVSELTSYSYDGVGQLKIVTLPDTSTVTYTYDDAHRLTNIADSLGNSIAYTLDSMGNRINEQVKDPSSTLARQTTRVYDALNRLQQITGAQQ